MSEQKSAPSARTQVRRIAKRAEYERDAINAIIDEAFYCSLGVVRDRCPIVLPTLHVRIGDHVYFHGAAGNAMLRSLDSEGDACASFTIFDGLVLARSAFHTSVNYRSVTVFGRGEAVVDPDAKFTILREFVDRVIPGRADDCRLPSQSELRATAVVGLPIDEASAKIRTGPPLDDDDDMNLPHWAGVVPLVAQYGKPEPDDWSAAVTVPSYLAGD